MEVRRHRAPFSHLSAPKRNYVHVVSFWSTE
jgi:hypothetical protein